MTQTQVCRYKGSYQTAAAAFGRRVIVLTATSDE